MIEPLTSSRSPPPSLLLTSFHSPSDLFWTCQVDSPSANRHARFPGEPMWDLRECVQRRWLDPRWWGGEALYEETDDSAHGGALMRASSMFFDVADAEVAEKMALATEVAFEPRRLPKQAASLAGQPLGTALGLSEATEAIGKLSLRSPQPSSSAGASEVAAAGAPPKRDVEPKAADLPLPPRSPPPAPTGEEPISSPKVVATPGDCRTE